MKRTSTKPSGSETPFSTHQGKVPEPDCFSTFGVLGALLSASTVHFGKPRPVTPAVQPAGRKPQAGIVGIVGGAVAGDAKGLETVLKGVKEKARNDDAMLAEAVRIFDHFYSAYAERKTIST